MEQTRTTDFHPQDASARPGTSIEPATGQDRQDGFDAEEYLESFSALKSSVLQGRDLKKKRKALEEYNRTLDTLKAAYADRMHIAASYDEVVREQEIIISSTSDELAHAERKRDDIEARISQANDALGDLKRTLEHERRPLEEELDRCNAAYAAAKDELKQVKAQRESLDLFDDDSRQAQASEAAHDAVVESVDEKVDAAKAAQRSAQKALDAREKEERSRVKKAQETIKVLNGDKDKAIKRIDELEKKVAASRKRIAFCEHVVAHPEESRQMSERIAENERTAAEMGAQIEQLSAVHARSKAASGKARAVVIVIAVALVIFVAFLLYVSNQ